MRVGSGGQPGRTWRHAGAGPVAVAGGRGRSSWRSAVALSVPHSGVGWRAGGGLVLQVLLRRARAQGRQRVRCGPLCGPRDLGAEAGAGRMSSGGRPSGRGGLGGRWEAWADQPAVGRGSKGPTPWGPGACRGRVRCAGQAAGGARARVSACPSGAPRGPWDPRLAGSAARGPRPGPGAWVAAPTGSSARGECGVVRAGRPEAGGLTGSPTRMGRWACRGRTQRAGRAAAGVRAGRQRAR